MTQPVNILLVEDDEVDIMNVQRAFRKNNISNPLYITRNGLEALDALNGKDGIVVPKPRIILLDINMPKMGGIEFLVELRKRPELRLTSVFVLTTSDEEIDKVAAYNLNVAGYILKPISFDCFLKTVNILHHYWQLCEMPSSSSLK